jgi:hypothetical protein
MNEHPKWTRQAQALLDESAQKLDASTLSRLNRARQAALGQRRARTMRAWFVPAGFASACVLLLAVAVWHGHAPRPVHSPPASTSSQPDELATNEADVNDDDEFYEDLDFYTWLEAQDQDTDG